MPLKEVKGFTQTVTVDEAGRIALPRPILDALGIQPKSEVILELTDLGVIIRSRPTATPITNRIARMNLPVAPWEKMEEEIEAGLLE